MYTSFEVHNFRCFDKLDLADLKRINLIAGVNNVGKTALLEALFLHCGAYRPELTMRLYGFRGVEFQKIDLVPWASTPWDSLFSKFDTSRSVKLVGEDDVTGRRMLSLKVLREPEELDKTRLFLQHDQAGTAEGSPSIPVLSGSAQVLELEYKENDRRGKYYLILDVKELRTEPFPPPPPFPASFLAARGRPPLEEEVKRFSKLEISGQQDILLEALQVIEPRLRRLALAADAGVIMIHGDIRLDRLLPLPVMGEGMARLASLVLAMGHGKGGVTLVDEIENGLHHSILPKVWQAIGKVARKFNTQVLATTHSRECIVAAHTAFAANSVYDFRLHRLERVKETVKAISYDQQTLEAAIETGLEVR